MPGKAGLNVSGREDQEDLHTTSSSHLPLPSFLEVQWSSVRVCDPLLTYKQPTSPKDQFSEELLKVDTSTPSKNLALLSPTPPSLDTSIHADLLMENHGCEVQSTSSSRGNLFTEDAVQAGEISAELWQM